MDETGQYRHFDKSRERSDVSWTVVEKELLPCMLRIGEALVVAGADVNHVERLLRQIGCAYGAKRTDVFVIPSCIFATMTLPDNTQFTQTRVVGNLSIDFFKLERLCTLVRSVKHCPLPPSELRRRFEEIEEEGLSRHRHYIGGVLMVVSYCVFFGGNALEALISGVFAVILCFLMDKFYKFTPNIIGFNFISTFVMGILIGLTCKLVPGIIPDPIIAGVIMLIIPGLMLTNAIRDMLSGSPLSGLLRFVESVLFTVAMVFGFLIAMILVGSDVSANVPPMPWAVKFAAVIPATYAILLIYNSRRALMLIAFIGALASYGVYILVSHLGLSNEFWPVLASSTVGAIYASYFSAKRHVPSAVFFIICVMPLIPGRLLFSTVNFVVHGELEQASAVGNTALMTALGIAVAICVVWTITRTWQNLEVSRRVVDVVEKTRSEVD